jgi:hypothetical protein
MRLCTVCIVLWIAAAACGGDEPPGFVQGDTLPWDPREWTAEPEARGGTAAGRRGYGAPKPGEEGPAGTAAAASTVAGAVGFIENPLAIPPKQGNLVINELMIDPGALPDADGEYIEVKNVTDLTLDLSGVVFTDGKKDSFGVVGPLWVEPHGFLTFARKKEPLLNGGFLPDYVYGSAFALANKGDEVRIELAGVVIDRVAWEPPQWKVPTGASLELDRTVSGICMNDQSQLWCPSAMIMRSGDLGSPGLPNGWCAPVEVPPDD